MTNLHPSWNKLFTDLNLFDQINILINKAYSSNDIVFPKQKDVLNLFKLSDLNNIKVVIIGQDPYHDFNQANGIAFSSDALKTPPSLKNIFNELYSDLNIDHFNNNDLTNWVTQGVFLINTCWTVIAHKPNSHNNLGWQKITKKILEQIILHNQNVIFCLWGNFAIKMYDSLLVKSNFVIKSAHPSPLSYKGFKNTKPFSQINNLLINLNLDPINWSL
ncbi:uracil-DNA glycosylase [Mycoplasma mycoides]|uniref:uracil-DNA glycosylase n=1 Tax=Mycoplasma mycoides TaxID=2102 RepID=UPI002734039C|nr:uracil-DNA glycosylase [Mycoplasma mycoides]MDP4040119.1 uracil-DNA glycosylase [Mycoplasma mycoides]MDP4040917.1 uracil-DNA glycosylase [Mycoplasma mycoides]MDP4041880.1 uracil-DNA glycosylase [Mycoplasma mycoides]MDP4043342.1 uracil-DNA glycosylase [Mycoplasma mycoides]MDP4044209.1 uracil-DNA glycosylase [Mycoplasma mycoides]